MSGFVHRLGLSNDDWQSIRGTNIFATMLLNVAELPYLSDSVRPDPARVEEWLATNCTRNYFCNPLGAYGFEVYFLTRHDLTMFLLAHA
jgi:hypothetical protein